jgi:hypothetical protein
VKGWFFIGKDEIEEIETLFSFDSKIPTPKLQSKKKTDNNFD